ncbi:hypothetical protein ATE84_4936 [Aquimarina sp. MAR_2010_214]|uniref:type VI secretion system tube protein TssD n=1 Tax=Aquimarina sp. MAR_2010_214 TaxID=1250026 RepID=UPI000C703186|nr:type VI secretion system tube protein TssD [Aquimarina sp. MAR_2010_214]PKV52809.1 hypothetical protein ATE84_4936 [Aquimarina sp. MAR_2010_214]
MGIIARLYADGQVYNVLQTEHSITQPSDETGRPISRPFHTGLKAVIEATKDTYFFEKAIHPTQQIQEIILEYADSMSGSRTRKVRFVDCYVTYDGTDFKANGREPLTETLLITAAGIEDSHSQGKYTTPRRVTAFLNNQVPLTTQEEETEAIKVTNVDGPFDEAGNKVKYISPKHEYYYHATLKNYEEGDDLNQIQWTASYDDENATQQLTTGGTYEDGILKTPIKVNKGKHTAKIYAYIGNLNPNINTKVTYKQVVTFFIGGAGDKESFYGVGPTNNIERGVKVVFDNLIKTRFEYKNQYNSQHLGYNEVKGEEDIESNILSLLPNKDGTQVNIVGHSLGGWNGAHLSQILTDMGYTVEILITLDPVGAGEHIKMISDIHMRTPKPKMNYWINIYTHPEDYITDDAIADAGRQWTPDPKDIHVLHITRYSHGESGNMFNEDITKNNITSSSQLFFTIKKYLETK